jgi:hypothetical protein
MGSFELRGKLMKRYSLALPADLEQTQHDLALRLLRCGKAGLSCPYKPQTVDYIVSQLMAPDTIIPFLKSAYIPYFLSVGLSLSISFWGRKLASGLDKEGVFEAPTDGLSSRAMLFGIARCGGTMQYDLRNIFAPGLLIACFFWLAIILVPIIRILKRTGHASGWSVLFAIPLVNLVALWIFAFKSWPVDTRPNHQQV